jgi:integrase
MVGRGGRAPAGGPAGIPPRAKPTDLWLVPPHPAVEPINIFAKRVLRKILGRAGLPPSRPYDLRHAAATLMLAANLNVKVVSRRLGHKEIQTTLGKYAHALPTMLHNTAGAVDLLFGALVRRRGGNGGWLNP